MLLGHTALAQYRVDTWTADNGLPIGSVNWVLQTRDGYLWLATYGGLARYDGAQFQVFNAVNSEGLRTSRFVSLFEDRTGDLWALTEGQGVTRLHLGAFATYTTKEGLKSNTVFRMFYDSDGRLLMDSNRGLVEWKDGRFVPAPAYIPSEDGEPGLFLGTSAAGAIWFTDAGGLRRLEHGRVTKTIPLHRDFKRACEDRSGRLWMEYGRPDRSRTLAVYEEGKLREFTTRDGVSSFRTFACFEDRQGAVWFGLANGGGLLRIENGHVTRFTTADGLPSNNVGQPFEDREGTLWVPSDGGLSWITRQTVRAYSQADGLAADNTYAVAEDHNGGMWIGGWSGITEYRGGVFTDRSAAFGIRGMNVMALLEASDGSLWIGTWGEGVFRVKDVRAARLPAVKLGGDLIRAMLQDRSGDVWVGGNGLGRYHNGSFAPIGASDGFPALQVFSLFEDRSGAVWIGTNLGVSRYAGGRFTNFGEREGFAGTVVRSLYQDADGVMWIGTYDTGLFRYANGRFTRYTTREGLLDNGAFQILEDRRGNLWLSCNRGIYRVSRNDLKELAEGRTQRVTAVSYGKRDGMLNAECNGGSQPAGTRSRDGHFWFATQKGVAVIDPDSIPAVASPPPVVIEQVLVDQTPVAGQGTIEIRPGQSDLQIRYGALTYVRPELAKFRYKLEPLDTDWVDAESRRTAYYPHLPFGTYRFRVIAANRDGVWNNQGASIAVRAIPPFWRTWWFQLAAAAAAIFLSAYTAHRRIRRLREEQAARETFSRQLIESQEYERKRIAAELHDSLSQTLSIIKNRATLSRGTGSGETALEQMGEIAEAAGDALAEVREIVHGLRPVEIDRLGLTKAIAAMAKRVAASSGIGIHTEIDSLDGMFSAETEMNIYRIVQEGLNNMVKHSGAAEAAIEIRREPAAVEIVMRDGGRGFPPEGAGAGLGLRTISERARIIGGKLQVASAPGQGATLTVRIAEHGK